MISQGANDRHKASGLPTDGRGGPWSEYPIEEFMPDSGRGRSLLLLGGATPSVQPHLEALGFDVVALDLDPDANAHVRGDPHKLPFRDAAFDVVLSMHVLEQLHSPWIAVHEVARVLRPGGWFVGAVAFLAPYRRSYFHMTHRGVRHLLETAGLEADRLAGTRDLTYTLYGGWLPLGRSLGRVVFGAVDRLLYGLRAKAWSITRREDPDRPTNRFHEAMPFSFRAFDRLRFASAVVFRARKHSAFS